MNRQSHLELGGPLGALFALLVGGISRRHAVAPKSDAALERERAVTAIETQKGKDFTLA